MVLNPKDPEAILDQLVEDPHLPDAPRVTPKKTRKAIIPRKANRYSGPLHIDLELADQFPNGYGRDVLQFKEFIDAQGQKGLTFEEFFSMVQTYSETHPDVTVEKVRSKFYNMNKSNTISFEWMVIISDILGYDVSYSYIPQPDVSMFTNDIDLDMDKL